MWLFFDPPSRGAQCPPQSCILFALETPMMSDLATMQVSSIRLESQAIRLESQAIRLESQAFGLKFNLKLEFGKRSSKV